jgi:signal transduction histidine kinase
MEEQMQDSKTEQELVRDFVKRLHVLKLEEETIKVAIKDLKDEYKEKIDLKTLNKAMKYIKIEHDVDARDTFDSMVDLIRKEDLQV